MAKLAAKKKPTKPDAPKKPSSRSKTGNAECSQAASNWQLSIRGKATLNPGTYQTLAKCRALSKSGQMADAQGRTGKLSDQGAAALKGRLQKRFDSGLITQKSRQDRLETLLKQRAEKGKPVVAKNAMTEEEYLGSKGLSRSGFGDVALHRMPGMNEQNKTRKRLIEMQRQKDESYQSQRDAARAEYAQKKAAGEIREPSREERLVAIASGHEDNAQVQAARRLLEKQAAKLTPPPAVQAAPQPARYSLQGKLAPGRGTEERNSTAQFLSGMRKSGKLKASVVGRTSLMVAQDIRKGVQTPEALTDTLVTMRTKAFLEYPSEYRIRKGKSIGERMDFRIKHHESTDIIARHALGSKGYQEYARRIEEATKNEIQNQQQYFLDGYDKNYKPVKGAYKLIYPKLISDRIKPKKLSKPPKTTQSAPPHGPSYTLYVRTSQV